MKSFALLIPTDVAQKFRVVNIVDADESFIRTIPGHWVENVDDKAVIHGFYDAGVHKFAPQAPYDGWTFNRATWEWEAPIPKPKDGKEYGWNYMENKWFEFIETPPEVEAK